MESNSPNESVKKVSLENLSREELIKRCERLLILAQKAKQAKDVLQEENNELRSKCTSESDSGRDATNEIIEKLTEQKLSHVSTIEDLKTQNAVLNKKLQQCSHDLQVCEDNRYALDNENVSFKRQIKRLTDENEQLLTHLEALERQMEECKQLGLEQQNQLLMLEKSKEMLEAANRKLQNDSKTNSHNPELEKMLNISLQEVQKLQSENKTATERVEGLRMNLSEKDKNIVTISEELQNKTKLVQNLKAQIEELGALESENVRLKSEQWETLKQENEDLTAQIHELEIKAGLVEDLKVELEMVDKEKKILKAENEELQLDAQKVEALNAQLKELQNNKELEALKCENVMNDGETLEQEKAILMAQINELEIKAGLVEDLKVEIGELREVEKENVTLKAENGELQRETKVVEDLKAQIEELESLKGENGILRAQNEEVLESNAELEREVSELRSISGRVEELGEVNEKLKEKLKSFHGKIVKLAGNVKALKENKNGILVLLKTYTTQAEEWKEQLSAASLKLIQHIASMTTQNLEYITEIGLLKESNAKFLEQLEAHKTDDEKSKELNQFEHIKNENQRLSEEVDGYKNRIEDLTNERDEISDKLAGLVQKHEEELKVFDDQSKKDTVEIQNRKEENEKICIEYRKVISRLEEDLSVSWREVDELKRKNHGLLESLEHTRHTEQQMADTTSEEILKLVQENADLIEKNRILEERRDGNDVECQTVDDAPRTDSEEAVTALKRENSELLAEMNEMNQALKERGEAISKFQAHCEEVMKKLQIYETQANRNVDNISQKEEVIGKLEREIEALKSRGTTVESSEDVIKKKDLEIADLKNEMERMNANLEESENMSTSTISRTEEGNRLKDLEGSWEERYGKLRTLAVKLKGKVRDLSSELVKEQNEKNDLQQKCANNAKTISTLQSQCDQLQDELESRKQEIKQYSEKLSAVAGDISKDKQKLAGNDDVIVRLKKEIEELNQEKANTEAWKKQISGKVQAFRKELEANKVLKKEYEANIAKLTADLEAKEHALRAESDGHQQTRHSLEHSNSERMKNSVLSLEMQDYERSVKELSQKLEKKQDEIGKLKSQLDSQKTTSNAIREQNKLLEGRAEEMASEVASAQADIVAYKKQISEIEDVVAQKEAKIQDVTQLLETVRSENEELSTELSKVIAEHQKLNGGLRNEKEHLRGQVLGLQQSLRQVQDTLRLKQDELKVVQGDYDTYKVRAQSVLRQNQNRDVGLEEKLAEELSTLKGRCETLAIEVKESKDTIDSLRRENESLSQQKSDISAKYEEISSEVEDLKSLHAQLSGKHQQTVLEHAETVRSLKVHADTLSQCYRQQLSEQEVRHNREIIELQSKIEKAPSPTEMPFPPLPMHREEGEGSESTENTHKNHLHPVPLERLLGTDTDQEVAYVKKQLGEEEAKVIHLTALLADTEQDLAKHVQMNKLLKEEIRRQQRSVEREKHAENLEYLKNVVFKFVTLHSGDERSRLVPVLNTILKLSPEETHKLTLVARGEPGIRGWTNYLPSWPSPSKPS